MYKPKISTLKSALTIILFLLNTIIALASGDNPKHHGNGIWTSQPENFNGKSLVFVGLFLLTMIVLILIVGSYSNIKKGIGVIIQGSIGVLVIGFIIILEFCTKVIASISFCCTLTDLGYIPQWFGGLIAIAIAITIPRSFLLRWIKKQTND